MCRAKREKNKHLASVLETILDGDFEISVGLFRSQIDNVEFGINVRHLTLTVQHRKSRYSVFQELVERCD